MALIMLASPISLESSDRARRGLSLVRVLVVIVVIGLVGAGLVARWYYGRRVHLTSEWEPFLGERGPAMAMGDAIGTDGQTAMRVGDDDILFRVDGDSAGDYFGFAVAALGDLNGDGIPDFAVGAHQNENYGERPAPNAPPGYARVFSGADGSEMYTLHPTGSAKIDGADDHFGWSIAAIDDLDGDGAAEIAVGAYLFDAEEDEDDDFDENTGATLLFSGATGEQIHLFGGDTWGDRFGYLVSSFPDRDGDGKNDLLIAVEKSETRDAVVNAGGVEIWSSSSFEQLVRSDGPGWEAHLGSSIATIGDVNADGVADFAAGAFMFAAKEESEAHRGAAGVFSGQTGEVLMAWEGAGHYDHLGFSIVGLGDVNGDGIDDVAIGANQSGWAGDYFGPGYVRVHSCADGALLDVLRGGEEGDQFGWMIANGGDRNGDGVDDLLVGAPSSVTATENLARHGRVYVYSGSDRALLKAFEGPELDDQFGVAAAALGDLDGDGLSEVLVGAPQNVSGQTKAGYAVVVSGRVFDAR